MRRLLVELRRLIKTLVPDVEESISYGIPAYGVHGKPLVYVGGYKTHIGFYPTPNAMEEFREELQPYATGKGTARFALDKPLPLALITRIVQFRLDAVGPARS